MKNLITTLSILLVMLVLILTTNSCKNMKPDVGSKSTKVDSTKVADSIKIDSIKIIK